MIETIPLGDALCQRIRTNLQSFDLRTTHTETHGRAAVAVVIVDQQVSANIGNIPFDPSCSNDAAILLTIRSSQLRKHAGQRAFPGGRIDPGETPEEAALRELDEEVGLTLSADHILGRLDDYQTRSGFIMTPVIMWGGSVSQFTANPAEVASIHRIPISELMRPDAPILEPVAGSGHPVLKMPLGDDWFAAPTAAIAYQFREVAMLGTSTRVNHFQEPRFAWT